MIELIWAFPKLLDRLFRGLFLKLFKLQKNLQLT